MDKIIDFSTAIESLKSLNSNTNSITQTISEVQVIVENTSNNISKLENNNGSLAENHIETYHSKLIGTVNHKDIFDEWAIWKINGCNNIQSTINNLISKISNLDNSINELKLKSINADAALAIMEKYNVGIEAILASGITLPQDLLDKSFASSQLATNMATDEYKADNENWQGISDENIKWWTDKVLKFEKDPNHIGSNAWLVWQQDENGEWVGMGFTDEETALGYAKIFNSELINYQEEIQQSIPKNIDANLLNTLYSFGLVSIIPSNQDFNDLKEDLANIRLGTGKKYTGTASEKVLVGLGAENTTDSLAGKEELVSDSGTGTKNEGTVNEDHQIILKYYKTKSEEEKQKLLEQMSPETATKIKEFEKTNPQLFEEQQQEQTTDDVMVQANQYAEEESENPISEQKDAFFNIATKEKGENHKSLVPDIFTKSTQKTKSLTEDFFKTVDKDTVKSSLAEKEELVSDSGTGTKNEGTVNEDHQIILKYYKTKSEEEKQKLLEQMSPETATKIKEFEKTNPQLFEEQQQEQTTDDVMVQANQYAEEESENPISEQKDAFFNIATKEKGENHKSLVPDIFTKSTQKTKSLTEDFFKTVDKDTVNSSLAGKAKIIPDTGTKTEYTAKEDENFEVEKETTASLDSQILFEYYNAKSKEEKQALLNQMPSEIADKIIEFDKNKSQLITKQQHDVTQASITEPVNQYEKESTTATINNSTTDVETTDPISGQINNFFNFVDSEKQDNNSLVPDISFKNKAE